MKSHGIEFTHRRPDKWPELTKRDTAEFMAFASLCAHLSVNEYVTSVFYDTSIQSFEIRVKDENLAGTDIGYMLEKCVNKTLTQAIIFGISMGK